jgi:2'-5' RNA ligase
MEAYAVVIVPPKKVREIVDRFRKIYAKYTGYKIPPHITIYPPFHLMNVSESVMIDKLKTGFSNIKSRTVKLKTINFFEGKNNVAYFSPDTPSSTYIKNFLVVATNSLKSIVKNVFDDNNYTPNKFNPHMTIAEKIPYETLPVIKKGLKDVNTNLTFKVASVFVYKEKDDGMWSKLAEIEFS